MIFNFEYETVQLSNKDNTESKFSVVYGQGGNIVHCKKDSYTMISTQSISNLGVAFIDKGYEVKPFVHKNGEVIGLDMYFGEKMTKIGDKRFNAIITVPNNGTGSARLSIKELRLICTNGAVRTVDGTKGMLRIPHDINYERSIDLMQRSLEGFTFILDNLSENDEKMNSIKITESDAMVLLSKWFFDLEMPVGHKSGINFNQFREIAYNNPDQIKSIDRYKALMNSFKKEIGYNSELGLDLSRYTIYAAISNYLTRRVEKSGSTAPDQIIDSRAYEKLRLFEEVLLTV